MTEVELCKEMLIHSMTSKKTGEYTLLEIKGMLSMFFSSPTIKEAQRLLTTKVPMIEGPSKYEEIYGPMPYHKPLPLVPYCGDQRHTMIGTQLEFPGKGGEQE